MHVAAEGHVAGSFEKGQRAQKRPCTEIIYELYVRSVLEQAGEKQS